MKKDRQTRLAAISDEIARNEPPPPADDAPAANAPAEATPAPAADMGAICRLPVMTLGAALTNRYGVPALTAFEVEQIANALAAVLSAHGVTVKDPRIVAWLTLGGAITMAAHPRVELYVSNQAKVVEPVAEEPKPQEPDAVAA